jgi:hypothetical protein
MYKWLDYRQQYYYFYYCDLYNNFVILRRHVEHLPRMYSHKRRKNVSLNIRVTVEFRVKAPSISI